MISLGQQESLMSGYRKLRNLQSTRPLSPFLFGDELSKSVKDITRANEIIAKVMPKKRKKSSDDRQNKRPFLRDRSIASRRAHYNYSFNKRVFSRGKPSHYNLKPFMNKFVVKGHFWKLSVLLVNLSTATII